MKKKKKKKKINFDRKYIEKLNIFYHSFDEMLAVAIKLEKMGYKLWTSSRRLTTLNGNYYYYDGEDWLRTSGGYNINGIDIKTKDFLEMSDKKYKKIENPDVDPYGEEDWGWEEIKESFDLDKNYLRKFNIIYKNEYEMFLVAEKLEESGEKLYTSLKRICYEYKFYYYDRGEKCWARSNRDPYEHPYEQSNKTITTVEFMNYFFNKNFKKIERPEVDPYGEEDWGWEEIKENIIYEKIKVGDKVECVDATACGDSLTKGKLYTVHKVWSEYDDDEELTYCDIGDEPILRGWFIERFKKVGEDEDFLNKLKEKERRKEEMRLKMMDVDPYGEEEWENESKLKKYINFINE